MLSRLPVLRKILPVSCLLVCAVLAPASAVDLTKVYRATLDEETPPRAREWTVGPEDVWRLTGFVFRPGNELGIELGPATLVIGRHESNALWAVVTPDTPAPIAGTLAGSGERVASLWLRFHPALVSELFPDRIVKERGPESALLWAKRIAAWKMRATWQADGLPVIPPRTFIVADIETEEGRRRVYTVDRKKKAIAHEPHFVERGLPALVPMGGDAALAAFDAVWSAFDAEYAGFVLLPGVDWDVLRAPQRARMESVKTTYEAASVINDLLLPLRDLHVSVIVGEEPLAGYAPRRPMNGSPKAVAAMLASFEDTRHDVAWGRTADGIGYVNVYKLMDAGLPAAFDEVLERLADTWSLVLDVRLNGGGDELLGRAIAGRFLEEPRLYSLHQFRAGIARDALGVRFERRCEPRGPWRYRTPVVLLIGPRVMSSAESFVLMFGGATQVTTMGAPTAGSSGNPRQMDLAGDIHVRLPRWLDLLPDGTPLERNGITPDVRVDAPPEAFDQTHDPVFTAALEHLREKVPPPKRRPGKTPKPEGE